VLRIAETLPDLVDLQAVWAFTKREVRSVAFRVPFELEILERGTEEWLPRLATQLADGSYSPDTTTVVELPKAKGLVRPIALMSLRDRLAYNAAVQACYDRIFEELAWAQGTVDFAYRLNPSAKTPPWFKSAFTGWNTFRVASLANQRDRPTVAVTDIAAFYENVSIVRLISDLRSLGCPDPAVSVLSQCLNRWCQVDGRGLPQDSFASHVLAKLYLHPLDRALQHLHLLHARYSDDLRVFCPTDETAQRALIEVARTLRRRGLNLQAGKTKIISGTEARDLIEGRTPTIKRIKRRWREAILEALQEGQDAPYLSDEEIDQLIRDEPARIPVAVIREAFDTFISSHETVGFDKSVFHFLLNQLARVGDKHALTRLRPLLSSHPQETSFILKYVRRVSAEREFEADLAGFVRTQQSAVYEAQRVMIFAWWAEAETVPATAVELARQVAFAPGASAILRATARGVLAAQAEVADLERLEREYEQSRDDLEKAQIICCLRRMERSRLRAFMGRVRGDGDLARFATMWLAQSDRESES
jgi:hypothetical protein